MRACAVRPFISLCLAVLSVMQASAQSRPPTDILAEDSRLQAKQTVRVVGLTMRDLTAELTRQTGVKFTASPKVAEDKAVLIVRDRPLADTLLALARFFRFTWLRDGQPGAYAYTLTQTIAQQQAEAREIDEQFQRAADQIMKELKIVRSVSHLSPEELRAGADEAEAAHQRETDPEKLADLRTRAAVLRQFAKADGGRIAAGFLTDARREDVIQFMTGGTTELAWPPTPGKAPLPEAMRDEAYRVLRQTNPRFKQPDQELNFATFRIDSAMGLKPSIRGRITAGVKTGEAASSSSFGFSLPMDYSYDQSAPEASVEPADWKSVPELMELVTAHVDGRRVPSTKERKPLHPPFLARALDVIDQDRPLDLISDAFYGPMAFGYDVIQKPMGEALTRLAQTTQHRWTRENGFILLRSTHYGIDRHCEPPCSRLSLWAKLPSEELYTLDRLAEIASQSYPQFETTQRVLQEIGALEGFNALDGARSHLILWNALSPAQRAAARSEQALPYQALNPSMRRIFELASTDQLSEGVRSSNQERQWRSEELAAASLLVVAEERLMWGYRSGTSTATASGFTREQAFESFRANNPAMTLDKVEQAKSATVRFNYTTGGRNVFNGFLIMPVLWKSVREP
jgi:hypothetical protein